MSDPEKAPATVRQRTVSTLSLPYSITDLRPGVPAACGLAAFVAFVIGITGPSLWIDEGHTWRYVTEPLGTMLASTIGSSNAVEASYYAILHFWIGLAGTSELALRIPSVAAMTVAVWMASKAAGDGAGPRAATAAGFVMIALPGVTRYAQEARPYAFAVAAVSVSTFLLLRALTTRRTRWWVGYVVALVVVSYAHLLSLLVVPGQFVVVLLVDRRQLRPFVVAVAMTALAASPIVALGVAQRGQISWIPPTRFDYLWSGLSVLTGSLTVTACLTVLVVALRGNRRLIAVGLPTALATPILLWSLSYLSPIYAARYLVGAAPGIAILVSGVSMSIQARKVVVLSAILVALVLPQQFAIRGPAGHNQDYRAAAALVASDCAARISYDGTSRDAMDYYLAQHQCAPSESAVSGHLWVVQASGPAAKQTGYALIRSEAFGMAIVSYWIAM